MQVVVNNVIRKPRTDRLSASQRVIIKRIKRIIRRPQLDEWERQHLKALLDLPLN